MRYYLLEIINPATGKTIRRWTTHPNGITSTPDPGALMIEFDVFVAPLAVPIGASSIRVWGVEEGDLTQAANFNGMIVALYGGMGKGLPLANPSQAGLLIYGTVQQAFGNSIGTNRTLDLIVSYSGNQPSSPLGMVFSWKAGTPLSQAIAATLKQAFPGYKQNIQISPKLVLAHDENHYSTTIVDFAQMIEHITVTALSGTYAGVRIVLQQNTFSVYDGTTPGNPIKLAFTDLIGQPTWYLPGSVQIMCVLRADIQPGQLITLPAAYPASPGAISVQASAQTQAAKPAFSGTFLVAAVRHVGNSRSPQGQGWITLLNAAFNAPPRRNA